LAKTYSFVNHARARDAENVVSRIEKEMARRFPPPPDTLHVDVIFLHLPTHDIESVLKEYVHDGEVNVTSTIILCSSYPINLIDVLGRQGLQQFPDKFVLGDPELFLTFIDEFMSGLAGDKIRTDLLAARAVPEALVGLYLLFKGGMDKECVRSYTAQNAKKLESEARVHFREGVKIDAITDASLAHALSGAFCR
jgi:hypothetical protein